MPVNASSWLLGSGENRKCSVLSLTIEIRIHNGLHDLVLSDDAVREVVYRELFRWLKAYF